MQWDALPGTPSFPMCQEPTPRPIFLVVHLFSGRRRLHDFHHELAEFAKLRRMDVRILSVDTAVSPTLGDLSYESCSWKRLQQLYLSTWSNRCPPCEAFSSARHQRPADPDERWPRPLRSAQRLWGLLELTHKELRQCQQGSEFVFQTLWVAAIHLVLGGTFIGEHPDCPADPAMASIWKSALVRLFVTHPDCRLWHIRQWEWGCERVKHTGRLPRLLTSMAIDKQPDAVRPTGGAIGKNALGDFETACLKEYPPRLGKALARAVCDRLQEALRERAIRTTTLAEDALKEWIGEMQVASLQVSRRTFLPDFQG